MRSSFFKAAKSTYGPSYFSMAFYSSLLAASASTGFFPFWTSLKTTSFSFFAVLSTGTVDWILPAGVPCLILRSREFAMPSSFLSYA
jgi:hypothetical protein